MKSSALKDVAIAAAISAATWIALSAAYPAHAQPVLPAPTGTPPGANWVKGGAGGGLVTTGSTFTLYNYPTLNQLPYKANPGSALVVTGIAIGVVGTAAGQPAAAAIGTTLGFVGSNLEKTSRERELLPTISERQVGSMAPVVPVFGGGAIGGGGRVIKPMVQ